VSARYSSPAGTLTSKPVPVDRTAHDSGAGQVLGHRLRTGDEDGLRHQAGDIHPHVAVRRRLLPRLHQPARSLVHGVGRQLRDPPQRGAHHLGGLGNSGRDLRADLRELRAVRVPGGQDRVRRVPADWNRRFDVVGAAVQAVAILSVVVALIVVDQVTLVPAAECLVMGLHFLPLARLFDQPQYRWTGAALCLVAGLAGSLHLWGRGTAAVVVAAGGAAVVLWATSLHVARVVWPAGAPDGSDDRRLR